MRTKGVTSDYPDRRQWREHVIPGRRPSHTERSRYRNNPRIGVIVIIPTSEVNDYLTGTPELLALAAGRLEAATGGTPDRSRPGPAGVPHRPADRPAPGQRPHRGRLPGHLPPAAGLRPGLHRHRPLRPAPRRPRRRAHRSLPGTPANDRHNSARTRNARLAAIHSLFRYAALRHPEHAALIQRVLAIPPDRFDKTVVSFLTCGEAEALLAAPDRSPGSAAAITPCCGGHPNWAAGLRAHRATRADVHLGSGAHVRCTGKGRKERCTPLTRKWSECCGHGWTSVAAGRVTRSSPPAAASPSAATL